MTTPVKQLPPAMPGIEHKLTIYREQDGQFYPYLLVLDSRMAVKAELPLGEPMPDPEAPSIDLSRMGESLISEIRKVKKEESAKNAANPSEVEYADDASRFHAMRLTELGYEFEMENGRVSKITLAPELEQLISRIFVGDKCPPEIPEAECLQYREDYKKALEEFDASNPDCTNCERNAVLAKQMDKARAKIKARRAEVVDRLAPPLNATHH